MHDEKTYKAQLAIGARRLTSAGVHRPGREARRLMQHACGLSAAALIRDELAEMDDSAREAFFDLIERRATGEPFEYLTGEAGFYGLDLYCTRATLIPRADSEIVVDEALARLPLGPGRDAGVEDDTNRVLARLQRMADIGAVAAEAVVGREDRKVIDEDDSNRVEIVDVQIPGA